MIERLNPSRTSRFSSQIRQEVSFDTRFKSQDLLKMLLKFKIKSGGDQGKVPTTKFLRSTYCVLEKRIRESNREL